MRNLNKALILLMTAMVVPVISSAQSASITFKAELTTTENNPLSSVYARFFVPGENAPMDSVFSSEEGLIEKVLPFSWSGPDGFMELFFDPMIIEPVSPNIISREMSSPLLHFNYPAEGNIYFMDMQGKVHGNHSELSSGLYFYYLDFSDGVKSRHHKLIVTERCQVNVELVNEMDAGKDHSSALQIKKGILEDAFAVEFIKDGYITHRDTVTIDSSTIEKVYQLEPAAKPSAQFSYSGDLLAGSPVVFDGTASTGAHSEDLTYLWEFGDGKRGQMATMPHIFITSGTYDISLNVSGNFGASHTVTQSVTIQPSHTASGFAGKVIANVTDMDQLDLKDVTVTLLEQDQEQLTDYRGVALLENLPVGIALHFKITKPGFVTQVIELTIPEDTDEAIFFTALKERESLLLLEDAEYGGTAESTDGATMILPVDALIKPDGSSVKGDVNISITPVDVAYDAAAFPGSFVGYRTTGEDGVLLSYGVAEYYLEQDGDELQLALGKTATIQIPIYTSGASIGDEIPLWSVDEESGTWVEEGAGVVVASEDAPTGLALEAQIGHLSWWNCDDWEEDKRVDGLCYRLECTSAICVRMKVGCWVSGAIRDEKKAANNFPMRYADREEIPPVFEVRDFIPETGKNLRFPTTLDVIVDARGFGPGNQLMGGRTIVEASDPSDTFAIELVPLAVGDTIDLEMNSIREDYLDPDEIIIYRVDIPEHEEYRIYAEQGDNPKLNGMVNVYQDDELLISSFLGTEEHWLSAIPGDLYIAIAGQQSTAEGNYIVGISERYPVLEGDTFNLDLNIPAEAILERAEIMHFRVDIPSSGLYRVDLKYGDQPSLRGRFEVSGAVPHIYRYNTTDDHGYILAEAGEIIMSVSGLDFTEEGNFVIGIWEIDATPLSLNDSISATMPETGDLQMYSISSGVNAMMEARFYQLGDPFLSGIVSFISPTGRILDEGNLYASDARIVYPMARDSVYYFEVEHLNLTFDYVLITEEDPVTDIAYGDTVNERLEFKGDKDLYRFDGVTGDVISIQGFQPDYQLNEGYFTLMNEEGLRIAERNIKYYITGNDYEIVYELPASGSYSIVVESHQNDTGSYQLILKDITPTELTLDTFTDLAVESSTTYYASFEIDEPRIVHFSARCDNGSAYFHLWDGEGNLMTIFNNNRVIYNFYNASFTGSLDPGRYFIRLDNVSAAELKLALVEARSMTFDEKGKAAFNDALDGPGVVNAYLFEGNPGDGVHGILKKQGAESSPEDVELKLCKLSEAGAYIFAHDRSGKYYSLDENWLYEFGVTLTGEPAEGLFVVVAFGKSAGAYSFEFHYVEASETIKVDDDFAEYPDATTSSHIAAGYAVKSTGTIQIASGEYTSMLPMRIESDYVIITGQDKEQVLLQNIYEYSNTPVLYIISESAFAGDLSLSCGMKNYYAIETLKDYISLDNIHIKPLAGNEELSGGIKGSGNEMTIKNITITNSTWGMTISSNGGVIEDCDIITKNKAIQLGGSNTVIRNNRVTVTSSNRAMQMSSGHSVSGSQVIEGNTISMTHEGYSDGNGIINVENYTSPAYENHIYVRNNSISTAGNNAAFNLSLGNPPSTIIVEKNVVHATGAEGGKAIWLAAARTDGVGTMIVRNNIFDGMGSESPVVFYGSEYINADQRFAIYNNNFRMSPTAEIDAENCFVEVRTSAYEYTDTARVFLANNIFQGNGSTAFLKCSDAFSIYSDYNVLHNFSTTMGGEGMIIGGTNDLTSDPIYIDDVLHVDDSSPVIDSGAGGDLYPGVPSEDIEGVARPQGSGIDIGAYEK